MFSLEAQRRICSLPLSVTIPRLWEALLPSLLLWPHCLLLSCLHLPLSLTRILVMAFRACFRLLGLLKFHRLGGLNNRYSFLMVLEVRKSKLRTPVWPGSYRGPSSWFAGGCFLAVSSHGTERVLVSSSSYKDTNPITGASPT